MTQFRWPQLRPYAIQAALLLLMGAVGWLGLGPLTRLIGEKQNQLQEQAVLIEHRQRQMKRLPELENQHDFIQENEERLDIILPKERIVEFIQTLESIAVETGVEVTINSRENTLLESKVTKVPVKGGEAGKETANDDGPRPAKKGAEKKTGILSELPLPNGLPLTVMAVGEYRDVIRYLRKMETLPIALDVVGVQLREHEEEATRSRGNSIVVNPFSPQGVPVEPDEALPAHLKLEGSFDTMLYLKNL